MNLFSDVAKEIKHQQFSPQSMTAADDFINSILTLYSIITPFDAFEISCI